MWNCILSTQKAIQNLCTAAGRCVTRGTSVRKKHEQQFGKGERIPGFLEGGRRPDDRLVCVLVGGWRVCVWRGGRLVDFTSHFLQRRLGQTSVKHTHPHTPHLSLSLAHTPTRTFAIIRICTSMFLALSHIRTAFFVGVCVQSHLHELGRLITQQTSGKIFMNP